MKKKILVTGSSTGLGLAIAKDLNKKGHLVVINGRNIKKLKKICEKEKFYSFEAGDLSKEKDAKKVSIKSYKKLKGLDAIICCIGESKSCPPNKERLKDWKKMFEQNFYTATNIIENTKKYLEKSKGKIICISSICGNELIKGSPITYSTSKAALNFYIKSLSHYLAKNNISINLISPGNIMFKGSVWDKKMKKNPSATKKLISNNVPMKKFGSLNDIVQITTFILTEKNNFITGANFVIDGGQTKKL